MRLIDVDNVIFEFNRMLDIADERNARPDQKEEFKTIRTYIEWARYVVECAPIVDAVDRELYEQCKYDKDIAEEQLKKIVRCKDCKHWELCDEEDGISYGQCMNPLWVISNTAFLNENWYCADGERKENVD